MQTGLIASIRLHFIGRRIGAALLLVLGMLSSSHSFAQFSASSPAFDYDGSFTVSWIVNPGSGYSGYSVLYQRFNGGTWTSVVSKGIGSQSQAITVTQAGAYEYKVDYGYCMPYPGGCPMTTGSTAIVTTQVVLTPPANAPALTAPATSNTGSYTVSWTSVFGTASYELEQKIGAESWGSVTLPNPTDTSKVHSGQTSNTYRYRVRACNPNGCSAYSAESLLNVAITPGMPASITVPTAATDGNFNVSWGGASGTVTAYQLEQQLNGGGWTLPYSGTALTTPISGLSAGSYVYRARACNTVGGYSSCSGYRTSSAVTVAAPASVPTISVPATDHDGAYTISWSTVANTTAYTLEEKIGTGNWTTVPNVTGTSKGFSGKLNNSYRYRVQACNAVGCTAFSSEPLLIVAITPGVPPFINVPSTVVNGQVTVSWGAASGTSTSYNLQEKQNSADWVDVHDENTLSRTLTGLTQGSYQYRVRACVTVSGYTNCSTPWREGSNAAVAPFGAFDFAAAPTEFQYNLNDTSFLPNLGAGELVALTQGTAEVHNGAAQYRVPLELPPAVNDLKPNLALTYNSRGNNGLVGVGWSLSGLSVIARCPPTYATEGAAKAQASNPRYTNADRLCLDGQKLQLEADSNAGDTAYWATGAEYRSEIDSFSRIRAFSGHQYFEVHTKDGRILTYGREQEYQNSRIYAPGQSGGPVSVWALDKVKDRYGNQYTVHYERNTADGDHYPKHISFEPGAAIFFTYEDRDLDINGPRSDLPWGYDTGHLRKHPKLLKTITTRIDVSSPSTPTSGTKVREYSITYTRSATTDRYLVSEIKECGFDSGAPVCAKPLTFAWQAGALGFETAAVTPSVCGTQETISISDQTLVDLDNDNYMDIVGTTTNTSTTVYWGTAANCFQKTTSWTVTGSGASWTSGRIIALPGGYGWIVAKTNPDRMGLVKVNRAGATLSYQYMTDNFGTSNIQVLDINNDGLDDFINGNSLWLQDPAAPAGFTQAGAPFSGTYPGSYESLFSDYTSDGLVDFMGLSKAYRNLGNNQFSYDVDLPYSDANSETFPIPLYNGSSTSMTRPASQYRNVVDFNGDGLPDLAWHRIPEGQSEGRWYVMLNTGNGFTDAIDTGLSSGTRTNQYAYSYDWDKDGRQDLIVTNAAYNGWRVLLSTWHNGGLAFKDIASPDPFNNNLGSIADIQLGAPVGQVLRGDFNNDGLVDLALGTNVWYAKRQQPDLLKTVTDGFGVKVAFDYSPLSGELNNGQPLYTPSTNVVFPERHGSRNLQVVRKLSTSDGLGGWRERHFNYTGAKQHAQGRGFLGFEKIVVTDASQNTVTTTLYRQDFPLVGRIVRMEVKDGAGDWISIADHQYAAQAHAQNPRFRPLEYSIERQYALTTGLESEPLSVTKTANTFDQYGTLTAQTQTTGTGLSGTTVTGLKRVTTVTNTVTNTDASWLLGFITQSVVQTSVNGSAGLRTVTTQYEAQPNTLDVKVRTDFAGTPVWKTTTTTRNASNGVITAITTQAGDLNAGTTAARTVTLEDFASLGPIYPKYRKNALNHVTTLGYDTRFGVINVETDPNGLVTSRLYNPLGRLIRETAADGTVTKILRYTCANAPAPCPSGASYLAATEVTHPATPGKLGAPLQIVYYDALQREVRTETWSLNGAMIKTDTEYDATGHVQRVSEPYTGLETGWTVYTGYDALSRPQTITKADGGGVAYQYLREGTLQKTVETVNVTTPTGPGSQTTIRYTDALSQVTRVLDAHGTPVDYTYDTQGNLATTKVNNTGATTITIHHDVAGNKTSINDPDAGIIHFDYNGFGELRRQIWRKNTSAEKSMTFNYDVLGRKTGRTDTPVSGSPVSYAWTWDTAKPGLLTSQSGNGITETYEYDLKSRPTKLITTIGVIGNRDFRYTYDAFSRPLTVEYPDGFKIEHQYHAAGLHTRTYNITPATPKLLWALSDVSDARGHPKRQLFGNGVMTEHTRDPGNGKINRIQSGRLSGNGLAGFSGNVQDLGFEFDSLGNLYTRSTGRTDLNGVEIESASETFTYDNLNRLKTSDTSWLPSPPGERDREYVYDALGNLIAKTGVVNYSYTGCGGRPHAICSDGAQSYGYDDYGNLTARGAQPLEYDVFNKPTRIGGTTFSYGPEHARFKQVDQGNNRTTYYINGGQYEEIVDGSGTTKRSYVGGYLLRSKVGTNSAVFTYLHQDHLGSVEAMTDANGNFIDRMSFDPWGQRQLADWDTGDPTNGGNPAHYPTTHSYTGHEHLDQVGLIHMGGRVYDPVIGRFLSPDLYIQAPFNSQSFNRYSYVFNNPLSLVDPSGYQTCITGINGGSVSGQVPCGGVDPFVDQYRQYLQDQVNQNSGYSGGYNSSNITVNNPGPVNGVPQHVQIANSAECPGVCHGTQSSTPVRSMTPEEAALLDMLTVGVLTTTLSGGLSLVLNSGKIIQLSSQIKNASDTAKGTVIGKTISGAQIAAARTVAGAQKVQAAGGAAASTILSSPLVTNGKVMDFIGGRYGAPSQPTSWGSFIGLTSNLVNSSEDIK